MTNQSDKRSIARPVVFIAGHMLDAMFSTKETLRKSISKKARLAAEDFKRVNLEANEHRALVAIFGVYKDVGYVEKTFLEGVTLTAYEICKRMWFKQDKLGRFGSKAIKEALNAILNLSKKTFTIYFLKYKGIDKGKRIYDALIIPNCPLLNVEYEASDVTEEDLKTGKVDGKVTKIHLKINPVFWKEGYYKLCDRNFYKNMKVVLGPKRRVSKYHWNFMLWINKQARNVVEINADKLIKLLKMPTDSAHATRERRKLRQMYEDFKMVGYIEEYQIDVIAQNGKTKDVITQGKWVEKRGILG